MKPTIACDVSYFQRPVNDSYPHRWLIFRSNDGNFRDPNFDENMAWAKKAVAKGKIDGFTVYFVYRPGVDAAGVHTAMAGRTSPRGVTSMCDVESWRGQIRGNRSGSITAQIEKVADWYGTRKRVLAYANGGDFANLYPNRPSWLRLVLASYGSVRPSIRNMIGWQYSDGDSQWPVPAGYPRSSKPFGRCDHNVFPGLTPAQLADELGVGAAPAPTPAVPAKPATVTPSPNVMEVPKMPKLVYVDKDECRRKRLAWPGWFVADGITFKHVATPVQLDALRKLGLSVQKISIATYRGLGGK